MTFDVRWVEEADWPEVEEWVKKAELFPDWFPIRNPFTLIAEREGVLAGAASLTWGPWMYGAISWIVRNQGRVGRGAGRFLVKAAEVVFQEAGMQTMCGITRADNSRMLAFERSVPGVLECPVDFRIFWKRLQGGDPCPQ